MKSSSFSSSKYVSYLRTSESEGSWIANPHRRFTNTFLEAANVSIMNIMGLGITSGNTIVRKESRSVVDHALQALQYQSKVCVTGHPGIGKTQGAMMYAIKSLFSEEATVLYVSYNSKQMVLCLPGEDGKYQTWTASPDDFSKSELSRDKRVVAVIDPPEKGSYISDVGCRVLVFTSNNLPLHVPGWKKDGVLLVTSMPTTEEVHVMTPILWNEQVANQSPHKWQIGKLNTAEEKVREVEKRIKLVGPIPRLVFNSQLFLSAVKECLQDGHEAARKVSDSNLYKALCGRYSPPLGKYSTPESSRMFLLGSVPVKHSTWKDRANHVPSVKLTPIMTLLLQDRLEKEILKLRRERFEVFALDWLCETEGRSREVQQCIKNMEKVSYRRISSLRDEELQVYRPSSEKLSFVDFVSSLTCWYKVEPMREDLTQTEVEISETSAKKYLDMLEQTVKEIYSEDEIREILEKETVSYTILTNTMNKRGVKVPQELDLRFFNKPVEVNEVNLTEALAIEPLKNRLD